MRHPFKVEEEQKYVFEEILNGLNKLNHENLFHRKIAGMYSNLSRIKQNTIEFNFGDCWTVFCESLFPNQLNSYIKFAQDCIKYRIKRNYFVDAKIFLGNSFRYKRSMDGLPDYHISKTKYTKYGLESLKLKKISAKKLSNNYQYLNNQLGLDFLEEIINEINSFETDFSNYWKKIEDWVDCTLNEVFVERNLETHNDVKTELSLIKLRESFYFIINEVLRAIIGLCNSKTTNLDSIQAKLEVLNRP